jgi:hypothetical protein
METKTVTLKAGKSDQSPTNTSSKFLYIAAAIAAIIALALLIDNIWLFKNNIDQYVAQGYPSAEVLKQLIPAQLLPGIFEPLVVYGGIALILWWLGILNRRISACMPAENRVVPDSNEALPNPNNSAADTDQGNPHDETSTSE